MSTQRGDTLSKSGSPTIDIYGPTLQPLKIFQFIIGELRFSFADESDNVCSFVFSDSSTSCAATPPTSTGAPPPTDIPHTEVPPPADTPSTGATPPTDTPSPPHTVTSHTGDISSIPSTLTTPTSNTDVTFLNPTPPSSPSASSTVSQASSHSYYFCSNKRHANTSILSCMPSL